MDSEEIYLYGTLMALAKEQDEAINKLVDGSLGFFGKSRIQSRGRAIGKFLNKIADYKTKVGIKNIRESIDSDLEQIKNGNFPKRYSKESVELIKNYL